MKKVFLFKKMSLLTMAIICLLIGALHSNVVFAVDDSDCGTQRGSCLNGTIASSPVCQGNNCSWTCSGGNAVTICSNTNASSDTNTGTMGSSLCNTWQQKCAVAGFVYKNNARQLLTCSDLGLGSGFVTCNVATCDYNLDKCFSKITKESELANVNDPNGPKCNNLVTDSNGQVRARNCDDGPACKSPATIGSWLPKGECDHTNSCKWTCNLPGKVATNCQADDVYDCFRNERVFDDWDKYFENISLNKITLCLKNGKPTNKCAVTTSKTKESHEYKCGGKTCRNCARPVCSQLGISSVGVDSEMMVLGHAYEKFSGKKTYEKFSEFTAQPLCKFGFVTDLRFMAMRNGSLRTVPYAPDGNPYTVKQISTGLDLFKDEAPVDGQDDDGVYDDPIGWQWSCKSDCSSVTNENNSCFVRSAMCGDAKVNSNEECDEGILNGDRSNCDRNCKLKQTAEPGCYADSDCDSAPLIGCRPGFMVLGSFKQFDPAPGCTKTCTWTCRTQYKNIIKDKSCSGKASFQCSKLNIDDYLGGKSYDLCLRNGKPSQVCSTPVVHNQQISKYEWSCGGESCGACQKPVCGDFSYSFGDQDTSKQNESFPAIEKDYYAQGLKLYTSRYQWPAGKPVCKVGKPSLVRVARWEFLSNGKVNKEASAQLILGDPYQAYYKVDQNRLFEYSYWMWECRTCDNDQANVGNTTSCLVKRSFCGDGLVDANNNERCDGHPLVPSQNDDCPQNPKTVKCINGKKGGTYSSRGLCNACQCEPGPMIDIKCRKICGALVESADECKTGHFNPETCTCDECLKDTDCHLIPGKFCRGNDSVTQKNKCNAQHKCELVDAVIKDCTKLPLDYKYIFKNPNYQKCLGKKTGFANGRCTAMGLLIPPTGPGECYLTEWSKCIKGSCGAKCSEGDSSDCYFNQKGQEVEVGCYKGKATCQQNCDYGKCQQIERCGDGITQSCEQCDDGNNNKDDDCDNNCKLNLKCGNGHGTKMTEEDWRQKWQDDYQAGALTDPKWLCANGKKVDVFCYDEAGVKMPGCLPKNEIVKRVWTCGKSIVCSSDNVGCAFPDDAFLSAYLTDTNQNSKLFFNNFLENFSRQCLREGVQSKRDKTIPYSWIGSDAFGKRKQLCKNVFCYGDDKPTNIVYHGWYYESETDKNLNPYWSWDCPESNKKYGSKLSCGAKEMGCAPHFKDGVGDMRYIDSLVNDDFPVLGNIEGDEYDFKIKRSNYDKLFDAKHLCFNNGEMKPIAPNSKPTYNFNYPDAATKGFYGNNIFEYYQANNDIEYQLQNDNQGRWLWTCNYGDDIETDRVSYPDYDYFKPRPIRKNRYDEIDPANYCFLEELAQCALPDSKFKDSQQLFTINEMKQMLGERKGLVSLCSSGYVDTNTTVNFPKFINGLRVESQPDGEKVAFYYCASDYRANSCATPLQDKNNYWDNTGIKARCNYGKSYEDPLCRIKLKGCNKNIIGKKWYSALHFKNSAKGCFDSKGEYVGGPDCNNSLCDAGVPVFNFKESDDHFSWTWDCGGDKCDVAISVIE